ncbi:MAG: sirohydrochlorin chelatase [Egibacteraceae bacterium]
MSERPALLLVAHGTRDPRGGQEMDVLTGMLRERLGVPVAHAWLEDFAEPDVDTVVGVLAGEGVERLVSLPLLTLGAGHAKTDVPTLVAEARAAYPAVTITHGRVLGLHPALFALAQGRVDAVSPREGRRDEVLVIAASGSSDPDANADLAKAARFLAEGTGHRWVEHCFAGVTWPAPDEVLRRVAAAGAKRVAIFSWSLLAGLLGQRVAELAASVSGVEIVDAGRFGPDPLLADVVIDRYREAIKGDIRANCDLCCYRVPLPGLERRVAAPSGGGTRRG